MLTVIDIFPKIVWIVHLKWKTGQEVANAFSRILKERKPSKMWVDKGREFYNKDVQNLWSSILQKTRKNLSCVI